MFTLRTEYWDKQSKGLKDVSGKEDQNGASKE